MSLINNYQEVRFYFRLGESAMQVSRTNPPLAQSRLFMNNCFERYDIVIDPDKCKPLIFDFENVKSDEDNKPIKTTRSNIADKPISLTMHDTSFTGFIRTSHRSTDKRQQQNNNIYDTTNRHNHVNNHRRSCFHARRHDLRSVPAQVGRTIRQTTYAAFRGVENAVVRLQHLYGWRVDVGFVPDFVRVVMAHHTRHVGRHWRKRNCRRNH